MTIRSELSERRPGTTKLREADVKLIKQMLRDGDSHLKIARLFGVKTGTVSEISRGRRWAHVQPESARATKGEIG